MNKKNEFQEVLVQKFHSDFLATCIKAGIDSDNKYWCRLKTELNENQVYCIINNKGQSQVRSEVYIGLESIKIESLDNKDIKCIIIEIPELKGKNVFISTLENCLATNKGNKGLEFGLSKLYRIERFKEEWAEGIEKLSTSDTEDKIDRLKISISETEIKTSFM